MLQPPSAPDNVSGELIRQGKINHRLEFPIETRERNYVTVYTEAPSSGSSHVLTLAALDINAQLLGVLPLENAKRGSCVEVRPQSEPGSADRQADGHLDAGA